MCLGGGNLKNVLMKYRSVLVITSSFVFNLVTSLLVWHPEGVKFNRFPMTVTEWICDIVSLVLFFVGFSMLLFDSHDYEKKRIKEAVLEAKEELDNKENVEKYGDN